MFYFLSKAIDFLAMPLSIVFFLLLYSFWTKSRAGKRLGIALAVLILCIISNGFLVNKAFNWWEPGPVRMGTTEKYDVGILLSGGLTESVSGQQDYPALGSHGDRVLQTYLLYKTGKIRKILITGTSSEQLIALGKGETRQAARLLVMWGVRPRDIVFEEMARNTRENALFSAEILKTKFPGQRYILVTSAFHMRRSAGCFLKAGIKTATFPADFYGKYYAMTFREAILPDPTAISYFSVLWHEWIGYAVYRLVGYC